MDAPNIRSTQIAPEREITPASIRALSSILKNAREKVLKKKEQTVEFKTGRLVGRALARTPKKTYLNTKLRLVELAIGDEYKKFTQGSDFDDLNRLVGDNFFRRQNPYGGKSTIAPIVKSAEKVGKWTSDIHDAIQSRSLRSQNYGSRANAVAGNFKVTPESRNTIRVTSGPDRRVRRKKYEWEKVGNQRAMAVGAVGLATFAAWKLRGKAAMAGNGDALVGAANIVRKAGKTVADAGRGAVAGIKMSTGVKGAKPFRPATFKPLQPREGHSFADQHAKATAELFKPKTPRVKKGPNEIPFTPKDKKKA